MRTRDGKDSTQRLRERRATSFHRPALVAALLTLVAMCCFFGAVALAGAAPARDSADALFARMAVQQAELTAEDGAVNDVFGFAVAVSGDTAVVGAPSRDVAGSVDAGAAYVFARSGGVWMQQALLTAADAAPGDKFGTSVAVSGDTALVGALEAVVDGKTSAGAAYVFTRSSGAWTQQAKTVAADAAVGDWFGYSVAISGDTAVVGAPARDTGGSSNSGAAYVFTRSAGAWTQQAQLTVADGATNDCLGWSVAVSGDTALAGAPYRDASGKADAGAAYIFIRSAGAWTQQAQPVAADGAASDWFGYSVALDGDTALVGAPARDTAGNSNSGAAYVFTRSSGAWTQQAQLTVGDGVMNDCLGWSVAVSGDTALAGAPYRDNAEKGDTGAAYVFTRSAGAWTLLAEPVAADGAATDRFGFSVAVSGGSALIGAPYRNVGLNADAGAAYVFVVTPTPAISKLSPASGKRGAIVTVTGTGFGVTRGSGSVTFGGKKCAKYVSWSATKIKCTVPAQAQYGAVKAKVTTAGGVSNAMSFTVKR